jgi:hypothetical protein
MEPVQLNQVASEIRRATVDDARWLQPASTGFDGSSPQRPRVVRRVGVSSSCWDYPADLSAVVRIKFSVRSGRDLYIVYKRRPSIGAASRLAAT